MAAFFQSWRKKPAAGEFVLSKSERYMAFLYTSLPLLACTALPEADASNRGAVLMKSAEFAAAHPGMRLEFGVYKGNSIRACAKQWPKQTFYGFDSFEGFPDDGRKDWKQDFSVVELPKVPRNVELLKGWFSDTLPPFLESHPDPVAFVHVDCDIYSSTKDVFRILREHDRLKPGVVLAFDELINYRRFPWNEMLALFELLDDTGLGIRWMACHQKVRQIDEVLALIKGKSYPAWKDDLVAGYRQQAAGVLTDEGIDYSLMKLPHVRERIAGLAKQFEGL
jgi:hypothetical protein